MSWLSDWFGGKDDEVSYDPYGKMTPEQKQLYGNISSYYNNAYANGGFPMWSGKWVADMPESLRTAVDNQGRLSALTSSWANRFTPGEVNPEVAALYKKGLNEDFYGYGNYPGAKALAEEQFAGSGGYWGSARAQGVMNAYDQSVQRPYDEFRLNQLQNSYQNALNYANTASGVHTANIEAQKVPWQIADLGLQREYNEWVRARPESSGNISGALDFLNLDTGRYSGSLAKESNWGALGSLIGAGVGLIAAPMTGGASIPLASGIMGGLGSLFDNNPGATANYFTNAMGSAYMDPTRSSRAAALSGGNIRDWDTTGKWGYADQFGGRLDSWGGI